MQDFISAIKPSRTGGPLNRLAWAGCLLLILFCLAAVNVWVNPGTVSVNPSRSDVTLRAASGNSQVQMFDVLKDGPNLNVTTFRDGYQCSKIGDLIRFGEGNTAMFFYKLECGGRIGYVNADWVRPY